uniref:C6 domain-containing protein n=1 Tax=Panagrellus redivivus TaxID=6233 RepID=A0A7E4VGI1_PANRE
MVCAQCAQIAELTDSGLATDGTITHMFSTNAQGCRQDEVTCTGPAASFATFFYYEDGASRGSEGGTTNTITSLLTCNANGEWEHTNPDNMMSGVVDQIECLYA